MLSARDTKDIARKAGKRTSPKGLLCWSNAQSSTITHFAAVANATPLECTAWLTSEAVDPCNGRPRMPACAGKVQVRKEVGGGGMWRCGLDREEMEWGEGQVGPGKEAVSEVAAPSNPFPGPDLPCANNIAGIGPGYPGAAAGLSLGEHVPVP